MAIKKSDLYSSLWASCDELRGGMDASQYKDYVLFMLFIKYISDKYGDSDDFSPPVTIPKGADFKDMVALKGRSDIGDKINTQVIQPLIDANSSLARSDFPDFNDPNKLGEGQAMVDRLTAARNRAALSVNQELIRLYHQIGTEILERQTRQGWGAKVIDRLAADLRDAFPDMKGFSVRNMNYMRLFAEQCPTRQFVQQPAAQIGQLSADQLPWFHIVILITKISDPAVREWYAAETNG